MKPYSLLLLSLLLASCSCPTDFRQISQPQARSTQEVRALNTCQIQHYGTTLLGQAPDAATAQELLRKGAKPQGTLILNNQQTKGSALWIAENPAVITELLRSGADPNMASGPERETPLCAALRKKQKEKVQALLDAGANPNQCDSAGETPLYIAASKLDTHSCQLLLQTGAAADIGRTTDGTTPLIAALKTGGSTETHSGEKITIAHLLLGHGASPILADSTGSTPLHYAPASLVPELISMGANPNATDNDGRTPLFTGGSVKRLETLLNAGANINAKSFRDGDTAFDAIQNASLKSYLLIRGGHSGKP